MRAKLFHQGRQKLLTIETIVDDVCEVELDTPQRTRRRADASRLRRRLNRNSPSAVVPLNTPTEKNGYPESLKDNGRCTVGKCVGTDDTIILEKTEQQPCHSAARDESSIKKSTTTDVRDGNDKLKATLAEKHPLSSKIVSQSKHTMHVPSILSPYTVSADKTSDLIPEVIAPENEYPTNEPSAIPTADIPTDNNQSIGKTTEPCVSFGTDKTKDFLDCQKPELTPSGLNDRSPQVLSLTPKRMSPTLFTKPPQPKSHFSGASILPQNERSTDNSSEQITDVSEQDFQTNDPSILPTKRMPRVPTVPKRKVSVNGPSILPSEKVSNHTSIIPTLIGEPSSTIDHVPKDLKLNKMTSLTRTESSAAGSSVDAEGLVEEFISDKTIDDDEPEINLDDFSSPNWSQDSIHSTKDLAHDRNEISEEIFGFNLGHVQPNSSLSVSSRGDMSHPEQRQNVPFCGDLNKSKVSSVTTSDFPSPPRPKKPLDKEIHDHKLSDAISPTARWRVRRMYDNARDHSQSRRERNASPEDKNNTPANDASETIMEKPILDNYGDKSHHMCEGQIGQRESSADVLTSQKVFSFYKPDETSNFSQSWPLSPDNKTTEAHQSPLPPRTPSNKEVRPLPVVQGSEKVETIAPLLKSALNRSFTKTDDAVCRYSNSEDDRSTSTVMRSGNQQSHTIHNKPMPPSPTKVEVVVPLEDVFSCDSSSAIDLQLDSFRFFEDRISPRAGVDTHNIRMSRTIASSGVLGANNTDSALVVAGAISPTAAVLPKSRDPDVAPGHTSKNYLQKTQPISTNNLDSSQEEVKVLKGVWEQMDAEIVRHRALVKMQRREIARLKEERNSLLAELKASGRLPRSTREENLSIAGCCIDKMAGWSSDYNKAFKCE